MNNLLKPQGDDSIQLKPQGDVFVIQLKPQGDDSMVIRVLVF